MTQGVRLPFLERGLRSCLVGVADVVSWARGHNARGAGSLLSMRLMGPPRSLARHGGKSRARSSSATITIDDAPEGTRTVIQLDAYRYVRDVPASSSVTAERDALLALLVAGESDRMTVAASGSDAITLTPLTISSLWELKVSAELSATVAHSGAVRLDQRQEEAALAIETFARGPHLADSAHAVLSDALNRTVEHDRMLELAELGIAVTGWTPPVDISAVAGGTWETRASALVSLNLRSTYITSVDRLESTELANEVAP